MKLSQFKQQLKNLTSLSFALPNGENVPQHFHITEAGITSKNFIDCGGTVRVEKTFNFQVWVADDTEHRLEASKLLNIISIAEKQFGSEDLDIEVEYQSDTISRYGVAFDGEKFILTAKQTDCLAKDNCGIPQEKQKVKLSDLQANDSAVCTPGGGCC